MTEPVRVIRDDQFREAQGTPGLARRVAFEDDGHWFGRVEAAPETMSGWHHHGDNVTIGYVLKGEVTFEFGPEGRDRVVVKEGECFRVPKHAVHREGNMAGSPGEIVLVRIGQGPVVFTAEGPEPS
jgi:mannose-6-phosphate isomerase-like protein (cupin superfamily)